jgi:putative transposase
LWVTWDAFALLVSPKRHRVSIEYALSANNVNYRGPAIVQFLRMLRSNLNRSLTIIWDQIPIHDCESVNAYLSADDKVVAEAFPPYAPEINPADGIWRYIKHNRLPNYSAPDLPALRSKVTAELQRLRDLPELLRSFIRYTKLPIGF